MAKNNVDLFEDEAAMRKFMGLDSMSFLIRQKSQSALEKLERSQSGQALGASLFLLPSAIAAVVIASAYDPEASVCGESEYTIDLQLFCLVGGYTQISYACLAFLVQCLYRYCSERGKSLFASIVNPKGFGGCVTLFYLVWAAIGFAIYGNEMSDDCQDEDISKVLLAWSVIQYVFIGLGCCCLCCVLPLFAAGKGLNAMFNELE